MTNRPEADTLCVNYSMSEQSTPPTALDASKVMSWIASGYRLEAKLEAALAAHDLSLAKLNVLTHLANARASLALSEIAAKLNCVRSNVTQLVDRLEDEGLVRRLYDPSDRRSVRAELTTLGRQRQREGAAALTAVAEGLAASIRTVDVGAIVRLAAAVD